ncbi:hypothetical protein C0V75_19365 [Tabrizicola sp. TH137]|uniref:DUF4394 domain-containing protein n=1 Tax=Tabrizicola sp. TH137 TaxID=2067452 RepID=UPI000C7AF78F|nr:DUF4394 domain-containing protein [Tabrizicola sp. TH137]PLL10842.1 hypothetical protein C0V75_19365 [Tabrizicola sp. TH137]
MKTLTTTLLLAAATAGAAQADTALGLTGDRTLVMIDTATAAVTGSLEAQGVTALHGIDWRPGTGKVIGLTDSFAIVEIDPATGATAEIAKLAAPLTLAEGVPVIVDVNPAADKLRVISGTANYRIDMATGDVTTDLALNFDAADANAAATPMVVAVAYSNSFGKPEKTAMYDIDAGLNALLQQTKPNEGLLATIGSLGVTLDGPVALDIATTADGTNTAWVAALGGLHRLDLATGAVSGTMPLTGTDQPIRDMTVLPAM